MELSKLLIDCTDVRFEDWLNYKISINVWLNWLDLILVFKGVFWEDFEWNLSLPNLEITINNLLKDFLSFFLDQQISSSLGVV